MIGFLQTTVKSLPCCWNITDRLCIAFIFSSCFWLVLFCFCVFWVVWWFLLLLLFGGEGGGVYLSPPVKHTYLNFRTKLSLYFDPTLKQPLPSLAHRRGCGFDFHSCCTLMWASSPPILMFNCSCSYATDLTTAYGHACICVCVCVCVCVRGEVEGGRVAVGVSWVCVYANVWFVFVIRMTARSLSLRTKWGLESWLEIGPYFLHFLDCCSCLWPLVK